MLLDFNTIVKVLDEKFIWKNVKQNKQVEDTESTAIVYGECGQGKSTTLNTIVELVAKELDLGQNHGCQFQSAQSFKSVTQCVKQGTIGPLTLIDTPGLNDPDAKRNDKTIMIQTIKNLSPRLYDPN